MTSAGIGPDDVSGVGQRVVAEEPMVSVAFLPSRSPNFLCLWKRDTQLPCHSLTTHVLADPQKTVPNPKPRYVALLRGAGLRAPHVPGAHARRLRAGLPAGRRRPLRWGRVRPEGVADGGVYKGVSDFCFEFFFCISICLCLCLSLHVYDYRYYADNTRTK